MRWLDSNWESCVEAPSESGSEKSETTAPIAKGRCVSPASECRASPIVTPPVSPALVSAYHRDAAWHVHPPIKVTLSTALP